MNSFNDNTNGNSRHNLTVYDDDGWETFDGPAWDVSDLLKSLPCDKDSKDEEQPKRPASIRKAHTDNLTSKQEEQPKRPASRRRAGIDDLTPLESLTCDEKKRSSKSREDSKHEEQPKRPASLRGTDNDMLTSKQAEQPKRPASRRKADNANLTLLMSLTCDANERSSKSREDSKDEEQPKRPASRRGAGNDNLTPLKNLTCDEKNVSSKIREDSKHEEQRKRPVSLRKADNDNLVQLKSLTCDEKSRSSKSRGESKREKQPKRPESLKKADNDNLTLQAPPENADNDNLTLKTFPMYVTMHDWIPIDCPFPKHEWHSNDSHPPPREEKSPAPYGVLLPGQQDDFERSLSLIEVVLPDQQDDFERSLTELVLPDQQDDFERSLIEVAPGVDMALRGSSETQQAISRNYVIGANCLDCTLRLKCIANAKYILCPLCHCVSPLELSCTTMQAGAFGVGLGFVEGEQ